MSATQDPEVAACSALSRTLPGLDPAAVIRVLGWAYDRYVVGHTPAGADEQLRAGLRGGRSNQDCIWDEDLDPDLPGHVLPGEWTEEDKRTVLDRDADPEAAQG